MILIKMRATEIVPARDVASMFQATRLALDTLPLGQPHLITEVTAPAQAPDWERWLEELGFIPGESVSLLARGFPGGDPLVVRVGMSTFALRQAEAACVRVRAAS
jgi:ferrous iron transport protein A